MNNEQEWRVHLLSEIKELKQDINDVKKEISNLRIRVAGVASIIGSFVSFLINKIIH